MSDIPLIHMDPRHIKSIWYAGEDAGGYSTDARFDGSTSKIVAYGENGQCAAVPFFAVYDLAGNIKARVPAAIRLSGLEPQSNAPALKSISKVDRLTP